MMPLATNESTRRFLTQVLPAAFPRIRYYGLFASSKRADNIARARELLAVPLLPIDAIKAASIDANETQTPKHPCPCCGRPILLIQNFQPRHPPPHSPHAPPGPHPTQ